MIWKWDLNGILITIIIKVVCFFYWLGSSQVLSRFLFDMNGIDPPEIKRSNGKSPIHEGLNGKINISIRPFLSATFDYGSVKRGCVCFTKNHAYG